MRLPAKTTGTGYARALYRVAMPNAGPAPRIAHHRSVLAVSKGASEAWCKHDQTHLDALAR